MHKVILKTFSFLKAFTQFLKILIVFFILMLILYWMQNLTGDFWAWSSFMNRFLDLFIDVGHYIAPGSIMLFAAIFEIKYLAALLLFMVLYAFVHLSYLAIGSLEEGYLTGRKIFRKFEEDQFNKKLEKQNISEQKKINRFQIYVEARIKPKFAHREYNINLDEQNKIMLKFLVDKTSQCPQKHNNGYLFTFESFSEIDDILNIFSKLLESKAPLDYIICVQILGNNSVQERKHLESLIALETLNKITTLADTVYRYNFNDFCNYGTSQLGIYQKNDGTIELHEFVRKD